MIFDKTFSHIGIHDRTIVCEENNRKYIANNINNSIVYSFKIDGEIIKNSLQKRCDYLVENETSKNAFFVELKGVDIAAAFLQLRETIILFADKLSEYKIHSRVVCSRVSTHSVNGSEYRKLLKECSDIRFRSRQFEENI